ncbi:hypothetical protein HanPSC8_Chr01g0036551 [Helianthus annuus]|nr:hypothetical protein HanPSC8_Chr01g0036551 [Helianthus annuus]
MVHAVILISCWSHWRPRNKYVFANEPVAVSNFIGEVKSLGFLWVKSRAKG